MERGKPAAVGNVMIDLYLYTNGNFRYGFGIGRTDDSGQPTVSYANLEAIRRKHAEFYLMDFNTQLEDCDPRIEIVIDSEETLREHYDDAVRSYKQPPSWAKNW